MALVETTKVIGPVGGSLVHLDACPPKAAHPEPNLSPCPPCHEAPGGTDVFEGPPRCQRRPKMIGWPRRRAARSDSHQARARVLDIAFPGWQAAPGVTFRSGPSPHRIRAELVGRARSQESCNSPAIGDLGCQV